MKKSLSLLAVLAVAGVIGNPAPVEASTRYVSALAGVSWFNDADINLIDDVPGLNPILTQAFDYNISAVAAIGCKSGNLRYEAEIGYQRNDLEGYSDVAEFPTFFGDMIPNMFGYQDNFDRARGMSIDKISGYSSLYTLMGNAFYDIPVGGDVEIYAMAGVGVAQANVHIDIDSTVYGEDIVTYSAEGTFTEWSQIQSAAAHTAVDTHETTLAYQLGAGIAIPISKGVKLDARYRYFATTDFNLNALFNTNISSHSALVGLRVDI
ncbi:MAG: porin family protein [Chlorobiaceae bacterium]|nr:porin family protein [Chlorobiaceae bacterium]